MKYFTKEICYFGLNAGKSRSEKAEKLGEINYAKYHKALDRILVNMPKRNRAFFKKSGQLAHGTIHQIIYGALPKKTSCFFKKKNYVEIHVTHAENGKLYILKYRDIRKCIFDYPSKEPIYYYDEKQPQIGDWFADELCMTKDGWLTHEIIFRSGAILFLEFRDFSYIRKMNNRGQWGC
jgi:hypothetical protein